MAERQAAWRELKRRETLPSHRRRADATIACTISHVAAQATIDEAEVAENDRQRHQRAHKHEDLGRGRGCGLPYRERWWNQIGKVRYHQSEAAQDCKRRCPIESAAGKGAVLHVDALDQAAKHQPL